MLHAVPFICSSFHPCPPPTAPRPMSLRHCPKYSPSDGSTQPPGRSFLHRQPINILTLKRLTTGAHCGGKLWLAFPLFRSQWPRGLRRRSTTVCLPGSWVRIPPGAWTFVCCECCVLSGRGLCDELTLCSAKSYRLWCVVECDCETS